MQDGQIIFEDYSGKKGIKGHRLASGTKTFSGVMAMAAIQDGLISLDEPVSSVISEWKNDPLRSKITVRHLLSFTSGLESAHKLLKGRPKKSNKFRKVLHIKGIHEPGKVFEYGPSHLVAFGLFMQRKLSQSGKNSDPINYLQSRVFDQLGIRPSHWTRDKGNNPVMPSGAFFNAKDWAIFGDFLNNKGYSNGKQIIKSELIELIFKGSAANPAYGLTIWLNQPSENTQTDDKADKRKIRKQPNNESGYISKNAPLDLVMAAGAGKQRLYIIPSLNLVISRQGESRGKQWSDNDFLEILLEDIEPL